MAEPNDAPRKWGVFRILKYILPLLFLFVGFFGIQIWMVLDEQNTVKPEKPVANETAVSSGKADLAKFKESSGPLPVEKPVVVSKPSAGSEQAIASEIPAMEYYRLQIGSFKDPAGAEKLKKKLLEMGYGSLIVKNGDQSKVIAMSFFSREQVETVQADMETKGVSGYPEKITDSKNMILLKADSVRLQRFMDGTMSELPEMLRELCDYYYIYESQGMDVKSHQALIVKQISRISDMKTGVENMQVDPEDQDLQTNLAEYLGGYIQYLEKSKKVKVLDRKSLWPGLLDRIEAYGRLGTDKPVN